MLEKQKYAALRLMG